MATALTRTIWRPVRVWVGRFVDFCYPGTCAQCGGFCDAKGPLCETCHLKLDILAAEPACARCAKPVAEEGAPCPWCLGRGMYPIERIIRLAEFAEPLKAMIHDTKYHGRWPMGEFLADRLFAEQRVAELLKGIDCVAAVPLHFRRQFERHYNQSEVIGRRLAKLAKVRFVRPLKRVRDTQSQTRLTSQQARLENVRGAFEMRRPSSVAGKNVLLVDDVMTTGATLQAGARALRGAKPASISAVVVAVADPKRRDFQAI